MIIKRDVFVCHCSEDKTEVVRPLVQAFERDGITCWVDEAEIHWGDSIPRKVNEGLANSHYVLVVFSEAFVSKNWPQMELEGALHEEASTGEVRVLPLLVGTVQQRKAIMSAYPILNHKAWVAWVDGIPVILEKLRSRLSAKPGSQPSPSNSSKVSHLGVVIPKVPKKFTELDKDNFLREAFSTIKDYFELGANQSSCHHPELQIIVENIHNYKFVCSMYFNGALVSKCKIWLGGIGTSNAISYSAGTHVDINDDKSCNDWLYVEQDDSGLGLRATMRIFGVAARPEFEGLLSAQRASEYLWLRATENLGHH